MKTLPKGANLLKNVMGTQFGPRPGHFGTLVSAIVQDSALSETCFAFVWVLVAGFNLAIFLFRGAGGVVDRRLVRSRLAIIFGCTWSIFAVIVVASLGVHGAHTRIIVPVLIVVTPTTKYDGVSSNGKCLQACFNDAGKSSEIGVADTKGSQNAGERTPSVGQPQIHWHR